LNEVHKVKQSYFILLIIGLLILFGCAQQEGESLAPGGEAEMIIPSSLEPVEVFTEIANATSLAPMFVGNGGTEPPNFSPWMPPGGCQEGFTDGFSWFLVPEAYYEGEIENASFCLVFVDVLKYENAEFAEASYSGISAECELEDFVYRGVALKRGYNSLFEFEKEELFSDYLSESSDYVIHSGCFIIYLDCPYGGEDACESTLESTLNGIIARFTADGLK